MLSDCGESRHTAAAGGGRDRSRGGDYLRREVRGERSGTKAVAQDQLLRGYGEFFGLLDPQPPARPGGTAGLGAPGKRIQLHGPIAADRSWNSGNDLLSRGERGDGRN